MAITIKPSAGAPVYGRVRGGRQGCQHCLEEEKNTSKIQSKKGGKNYKKKYLH